MSDAEVILKWQHCEKIANELRVDLSISSDLILISGRNGSILEGKRNADGINELFGFLCGLLANKERTKRK